MRTPRALALAALAALVGCSQESVDQEEEGFTLDAVTGSRPYRPDVADVSGYPWDNRTATRDACTTSAVGTAVYEAAKNAKHGKDIIPSDLLLTTRNQGGPGFLESSEMWPALGGLIAEAKYEVDLQWHIIEADSDGFHNVIGGLKKLHDRLAAEKAAGRAPARPVTVRIISPDWLVKPGNSTQKFASAIRQHAGAFDPSLIHLEVAAHRYLSLAVMHVKMAVIDGVTVHVGGGNLSNHQNYHDDSPHERDSAYAVRGEIGRAALAQFDDLWNHRATVAYSCDADRCKKLGDREKLSVASEGKPGSGHVPEVASPDLTAAGIPEDACVPMVFLAKRASENVLSWDTNHPIGKGFIAAFGASKKVLKISTPNLNDRFVGPVIDAAKNQQTNVQLMVPMTFNELTEAMPYLGGGTNRMVMWWLQKRIGAENVGPGKLLDGRWFSKDGRTAQRGGWSTGGRHAKYYSVDDTLAIIGSTNLDKQSMSRSREVGIAVDDPAITRKWDAKIFDGDFAKAISVSKDAAQQVPAELEEENMEAAPVDTQEDFQENL